MILEPGGACFVREPAAVRALVAVIQRGGIRQPQARALRDEQILPAVVVEVAELRIPGPAAETDAELTRDVVHRATVAGPQEVEARQRGQEAGMLLFPLAVIH